MLPTLHAPGARADDNDLNRLLRRVDWRFLLPTPEPRFTAMFVDGELRDALSTVSTTIIDARDTDVRQACDLAVVDRSDAATLAQAFVLLRAGGSCYGEIETLNGRSADVIRRRFESAGFTDIVCYRPTGGTDRQPAAWIPVDEPAARRWERQRRPKPQSPRELLGATARKLVSRARGTSADRHVLCAIARKPGAAPLPDRRRPTGADFQSALHCALAPAIASPDGGTSAVASPWLLLTPGRCTVNKVVLLALGDAGTPELVVKVPRTDAAGAAIAREASVLNAVHALQPDLGGVPHVIYSGACAGIRVVAESALDGTPISQMPRRSGLRSLAMKAAEWQLALVHRSSPTPRSLWWPTLIGPVVDYLTGPLGALVDGELARRTVAAFDRLDDLPIACEQRDFSPWNVLMTPGGELAVLDWESGEPYGLPALDLIYFLTYLARWFENAKTHDELLQVHRSTLDPATPLGRVTHDSLTKYMRLVGIDMAALPPLRALCWLIHSRAEYVRLTEQEHTFDPAALRRSAFLALWEQEVRSFEGVAA